MPLSAADQILSCQLQFMVRFFETHHPCQTGCTSPYSVGSTKRYSSCAFTQQWKQCVRDFFVVVSPLCFVNIASHQPKLPITVSLTPWQRHNSATIRKELGLHWKGEGNPAHQHNRFLASALNIRDCMVRTIKGYDQRLTNVKNLFFFLVWCTVATILSWIFVSYFKWNTDKGRMWRVTLQPRCTGCNHRNALHRLRRKSEQMERWGGCFFIYFFNWILCHKGMGGKTCFVSFHFQQWMSAEFLCLCWVLFTLGIVE